jgi:hypothetical protein
MSGVSEIILSPLGKHAAHVYRGLTRDFKKQLIFRKRNAVPAWNRIPNLIELP